MSLSPVASKVVSYAFSSVKTIAEVTPNHYLAGGGAAVVAYTALKSTPLQLFKYLGSRIGKATEAVQVTIAGAAGLAAAKLYSWGASLVPKSPMQDATNFVKGFVNPITKGLSEKPSLPNINIPEDLKHLTLFSNKATSTPPLTQYNPWA